MRIAFWGTPDFAIPSLRGLLGEGHDVVGVITQPDRPRGRGRKLRASPVKEAALTEGLPVLTPERPRGESFIDAFSALDPELSVVVAYGHILVSEVLGLPGRGSINVHASLLPELRGAAPINWAIARGYDRTGVTIMRMTEGMDEGPILLQQEVPIGDEDTTSTLTARLSEVGAEALIETLALLEVEGLQETPQDHDRATYAPKIDRASARIVWDRPSREVADLVRAMDAVPGAWTVSKGQPLKLFSPSVVTGTGSPGEVLVADAEGGFVVRTRDGAVSFAEAQAAGKRRMAVADWLRGGGPPMGSVLG